MDVAVVYVDAVFVLEGGVGAFPGCDTATAGTQLDV